MLAVTPDVAKSTVIEPELVIGEPELVILPEVPLTVTEVTVPAPPVGADHVPSALKKFVIPPPEAGTKPGAIDVN